MVCGASDVVLAGVAFFAGTGFGLGRRHKTLHERFFNGFGVRNSSTYRCKYKKIRTLYEQFAILGGLFAHEGRPSSGGLPFFGLLA